MGVNSGCEISAIYCKGNIFKLEVEWMGCRENVRFLTEVWPYLRNGERGGLGYY